MADEYARDFLEPFVSANRVDGETVAIQAEADVAGLWYQREALDRARRPPPATWRELVATARTRLFSGSRCGGFHCAVEVSRL